VKSVSSRTSAWRARRASKLSAGLRQGELPHDVSLREAALGLMQRGRALIGIRRAEQGCGMPIAERLRLANEARRRKREQRIQNERMERLCRPWRESTRDL
jgi:hypothetical protein